MSGTFKGVDLFGSGPHRFSVGPLGQFTVPKLRLGIIDSGTAWLGLQELTVVVTGRLIAPSESALWARRDAIAAQLIDPPTRGTLTDGRGRTFEDMSFLSYEESAEGVESGRTRSVAYVAVFRRLKDNPG